MGKYKQFIYNNITFESGVRHSFIVDTGSGESIISRGALKHLCPSATAKPTTTRIYGVTGYLPLMGETILSIHSQDNSCVPIRFLVSQDSPSFLGLMVMRTLGHSLSLHTNELKSDTTEEIQKLVIPCTKNAGGINVPEAVLEVDSEPVFLKRLVLPYGQREGVLNAIDRMEKTDVISRVTSSPWTTPIVVAMKCDARTPRICDDYRLTINPRLRKCAAMTMETEDFMDPLHGCQFFSKIDLADAYLQIPLHPDSRAFTTIKTP
ncbi:unnamed protein product [Echinostoma caproni]|uniref:Reverse transcriptase domain-containing protein n=1 Tax=Echinostoma caproni TaxID=27848 RepID=A0A183ARY9_9TREM|nr:unnamed protein product [Echinostoma caproni]